MKGFNLFARGFSFASSLAIAAICAGCASSGPSSEKSAAAEKPGAYPLPAGVTLKKAKHVEGVWLKPGFDFTGHPALVVEPTVFKAIERSNEAAMRAFAITELQEAIGRAARESGLFSSVAGGGISGSAATNGPTLRLVNTIIEFEKGGGGARYFAGLYGAGQPVLKVRGEMVDASNAPVFVFEARRSGDTAASRLVGAFRSDEEIQREDIRDMAVDLADFMMITAGQTPPKR